MSEWWSYRPADFLMFAPRTYWRLFELQNDAWWPAHPLLLLAALAWLGWVLRPRSAVALLADPSAVALRVGAIALALAWAFVAGAFLLARYAPVNWAASGFAVGFFLQTAGLTVLAMQRARIACTPARHRTAALLWVWAVVGHPLLAPAFGRPWTQAEVIGLAPDPTAIATLALLLWFEPPATRAARALLRALWAVPLAWCAISAATLWTMGSPQGWVMLLAPLAALGAASVRAPYSFTDPVIPDT